MALQPWVTNTFKPLDMFGIQGYPHAIPDKFDKWLPKFPSNNVKIIHLIMMMKMYPQNSSLLLWLKMQESSIITFVIRVSRLGKPFMIPL